MPLPLRKDFPRSGGRCRAATKVGIWQSRQALTERAHAVSLVVKVSDAIRNLPATAEAFTRRGKVARSDKWGESVTAGDGEGARR